MLRKLCNAFAILALLLALGAGFARQASAEFFGCDDQHHARAITHTRIAAYATEPSVQAQPRVIIHPRRHHLPRNAKRYCRSWLVKEYRVSGTVVVPRMRCWWR